MVLEGLLPAEAQLFLGRGGLTDGRAQLNIFRIPDGNPLALSLALRLALRRGTHHLASSPEWQLSIRNLAERLLEEVEDPAVRPLVSACAVIGRVDESTLAAVSGRVNDAATFNRLCRLSIMRPTRHGIIVQPEARRILAQDLRWRRFDEYRALQAWARARNATATPPPKPPLASPPERPEMIRLANDGPPPPVEQLTPREREVLDLLASGRLASREIAARLVISVGTANLHVKRILHKLGFVTRAELAMWWMRRDRDAPIGSFQRDGLSSGRATPARPPWGT
jgi:DNA-binding CsgD family transcriptional regulator